MSGITRRGVGVSAAALAGIAACGQTPTTTRSTAPAIGAFGLDLTAGDARVKPGDDFNRYVNGAWIDRTQIPPDQSEWGSFVILAEKAERDIRAIADDLVRRQNPSGSNEQKIADYYKSFVDRPHVDSLGMAPAQADLAAINACTNLQDVVSLVGRADFPAQFPLSLYITLDDRNPDRFIVGLGHSGISLPDREYYFRPDPDFARIRDAFKSHVAKMFDAAGVANGVAKANALMAFETEIARRHWRLEQRREREAVYNPRTLAQLQAMDVPFPWAAWLAAHNLNHVSDFVVAELSAIAPLAQLCRRTPIDTWKAYLTYSYLSNSAPLLPKPLDDENFNFYGRTLNGQPEQRERAKRGVSAINNALGKAVGKLYVERHFPPEAKAQVLALVENMRRAYAQRIQSLSWMSAETKVKAQEKLARFTPKIGYPDTWRDYSQLEVRAGDAFGNSKRANAYAWNYDLARLGRPTDRTEWLYMDPQEVNAYYNASFNEIVFSAAILQPPFFDPNADAAVNYGGIGAVIGHEMGHGFDDQGAKSDASGVLRDWWNAQDVRNFSQLTHALVEQYAAFEALPGLHLNGQNTLGENIGDNGGLQVAYAAYHLSLNGREAPVLSSLTGDQRFFMGWAQVWRTKMRDDYLRTVTASNEHSPDPFRVNGAVRNMAPWYAAFNVQAGEALYLPPDRRVTIW